LDINYIGPISIDNNKDKILNHNENITLINEKRNIKDKNQIENSEIVCQNVNYLPNNEIFEKILHNDNENHVNSNLFHNIEFNNRENIKSELDFKNKLFSSSHKFYNKNTTFYSINNRCKNFKNNRINYMWKK